MRIVPFALSIFLGAFLLFQVQPLIARYILPWFGGSAGVWSVTLLFFQSVLLLGYAYSHLISTRLKPRAQAVVHVLVMLACAAVLPIVPPDSLRPEPDAQPLPVILLLLAATVGAPYFALAATGPLVQAWFVRAVPGRAPWPLYALSNAGSLLALLSYPFVVERAWGRHDQAVIWSVSFCVFALLMAGAALLAARAGAPAPAEETAAAAPTRRQRVLWVALPAVASALLLAVTNELCLDAASVPFLWVLPLGLYLMSFIVTFAGRRGPRRMVWYPLAGAAMAAVVAVMHNHTAMDLLLVIGIHGTALLVLCIVLHGETYRVRPEPARLTEFYMHVALGGALGGLFVAVIAPVVFPMYLELHVALLASALALLACLGTARESPLPRPLWAMLAAAVLALAGVLAWHVARKAEGSVLLARNFHGVYTVYDTPGAVPSRSLYSGSTLHGYQFTEPRHRRNRTAYYGVHSGAGVAANSLARGPRRIGVIGLGAGVMAAYGREGAGDVVRFYELNPRCETIARGHFFFLGESFAKCEVATGDARLVLEREEPQAYHLLLVDAFTSDAIPVHLLTLEAFELYLRHVRPGGGIGVHITNRHFDLLPVVRAAAVRLGLEILAVQSAPDERYGTVEALWVLLSRSQAFLDAAQKELETVRSKLTPPGTRPESYAFLRDVKHIRETTPWTDDSSNLFESLK